MSNPFETSSNPFEDEDGSKYRRQNRRNDDLSAEERLQRMMQEIEDSEARQLESTRNALRSIDDSERIGIATAEDLIHQREQLDNIENKTGKINQDLKTSQKHLTSIKSIFGGIKNWWNGDKDRQSQPPQSSSCKLQAELDKNAASKPHPGERYKMDDGHGFYEDDDLDDKFMKGSRNPDGQKQYFKPVTHSKREEALNQNLDMMSDGIGRLKGLAKGLGDEIQSQNDQLDRINASVDRADIKLKDQNRQMCGILK